MNLAKTLASTHDVKHKCMKCFKFNWHLKFANFFLTDLHRDRQPSCKTKTGNNRRRRRKKTWPQRLWDCAEWFKGTGEAELTNAAARLDFCDMQERMPQFSSARLHKWPCHMSVPLWKSPRDCRLHPWQQTADTCINLNYWSFKACLFNSQDWMIHFKNLTISSSKKHFFLNSIVPMKQLCEKDLWIYRRLATLLG